MPSPDITPYVDLSIYDKDPQDLYDDAVAELAISLPEWIPREGNIEVLLLESLAMEVAESVFTLNRLPAGIVEVLLRLFDIERDNGSAPVMTLQFTMIDTLGHTIPVGTQARLTLPGGLLPVVFTTDTELTITAGSDTGTVTATGDRFTDEANGITVGTDLELLDAIISVSLVEISALTTGGTNPETDDDYFTRAVARFSRLNDTLVLPDHFEAYALEDPRFHLAFAIDNWDSVSGTPGSDGGHITVAVYGNDAFNTSDEKNELEAAMEAIALANLDIHIIDPTIDTQDVTTTVQALPGFDAATVTASITTALEDYLDPMTWDWGGTVRRFELIALIDRVEGVDYVSTMTTPAADVTLTGNAPLVDAGTLNITVNEA